MQKLKKGIVLPFLLLLASVVLIIGAFFVLDNKPKTTNQKPTQTASPANETTNWKTFISDRVSFKYPPNLFVVTGNLNEDEASYSFGIVDDRSIDYRLAGFSIDASLKNNPYYSDYNKTLLTLKQGLIGMQTRKTQNGGIEIFGQIDPNWQGQGAGIHVRNTVFKYGNGAVVVNSPQEYAKYIDDTLYDKIVNTFQFTNQNLDTTKWKTYKEDGFSFNYAPDWKLQGNENYVYFSKRMIPEPPPPHDIETGVSVRFEVENNTDNATLDNWVEKKARRSNYEGIGLDYILLKQKRITSYGIETVEAEFPATNGEFITVFFHANKIYLISYDTRFTEAAIELKNQILSTFQFIN